MAEDQDTQICEVYRFWIVAVEGGWFVCFYLVCFLIRASTYCRVEELHRATCLVWLSVLQLLVASNSAPTPAGWANKGSSLAYVMGKFRSRMVLSGHWEESVLLLGSPLTCCGLASFSQLYFLWGQAQSVFSKLSKAQQKGTLRLPIVATEY